MVAKFSRDSVDLTPHGKRWQKVKARDVRVGDLVAGLGEIVECGTDESHGASETGLRGHHSAYSLAPDDEVTVFR